VEHERIVLAASAAEAAFHESGDNHFSGVGIQHRWNRFERKSG
jgi:hypothetical protein